MSYNWVIIAYRDRFIYYNTYVKLIQMKTQLKNEFERLKKHLSPFTTTTLEALQADRLHFSTSHRGEPKTLIEIFETFKPSVKFEVSYKIRDMYYIVWGCIKVIR